jgi:hypothetical protein
MCRCACQISSDLRYQYLQITRSTSEIFLWCTKSSLERLNTWHSTNSHGRFQCGPFIQKRWCNHMHIFCFWTEYKMTFIYVLYIHVPMIRDTWNWSGRVLGSPFVFGTHIFYKKKPTIWTSNVVVGLVKMLYYKDLWWCRLVDELLN